ncbi:MAG: hypothetical protein V5A37_01650 [Halobacteriales archaeon]
MKDTKFQLPETLRAELDRNAEDARDRLEGRTEQTRRKVDERADVAKEELGERLFDLGEEYFPEVARRRQRRVAATAFAAGVAAGAVGRHLLDR